jgi:predicted MFS family arabinose efflux permease
VIWPSRSRSIIPFVFALGFALLALFMVVERRKERRAQDPLFEFSLLHHRTFRYGLVTSAVLAMGQLGLLFALAVFLQDGRQLSAQSNGLWLLPLGAFIIIGSQVGARLTRTIGTTRVVQVGLASESVGAGHDRVAHLAHDDVLRAAARLICFGLGLGFASSQLTNVVLSAIDPERSGVASGANTTVRQVGGARRRGDRFGAHRADDPSHNQSDRGVASLASRGQGAIDRACTSSARASRCRHGASARGRGTEAMRWSPG